MHNNKTFGMEVHRSDSKLCLMMEFSTSRVRTPCYVNKELV